MTSKRKKQLCALLKGIETGNTSSVAVVNQNKYIQHNPQTHEGGEGLAALFKRLSKSNPRIADDFLSLRTALSKPAPNSVNAIQYIKNHRILAEGIPPRNEWKNTNGKF